MTEFVYEVSTKCIILISINNMLTVLLKFPFVFILQLKRVQIFISCLFTSETTVFRISNPERVCFFYQGKNRLLEYILLYAKCD